MRQLLQKIIYLIFAALILVPSIDAQQRKASDAAKKKGKIERSYKKAYAKARKRTIKHRHDIQTEATSKRMDAAEKRAEAFNKQNDPTFIERFLSRKRPRKR
jgi:hypothetical protein